MQNILQTVIFLLFAFFTGKHFYQSVKYKAFTDSIFYFCATIAIITVFCSMSFAGGFGNFFESDAAIANAEARKIRAESDAGIRHMEASARISREDALLRLAVRNETRVNSVNPQYQALQKEFTRQSAWNHSILIAGFLFILGIAVLSLLTVLAVIRERQNDNVRHMTRILEIEERTRLENIYNNAGLLTRR